MKAMDLLDRESGLVVTCSKLSISMVNTRTIGSWREVRRRGRDVMLAHDEQASLEPTDTDTVDTNHNRFAIHHRLIHSAPLPCRTTYYSHVNTTPLQLYLHLTICRNRDRYLRHVLPR